MSLNSTWSVANINRCGCELFVYAPYMQSKFNSNSNDCTLMSCDSLPAWAEIKVKKKPSYGSLIFYLIFGHILGAIFLFWCFRNSFAGFHIFLSIFIVYLWLYTSVGEVTVLISGALGVQCSCHYLSGRWRRSSLIPVHRIRAVHLLDRVTNASVNPHIFLELWRTSSKSIVIDQNASLNPEANKMLFESKAPAGTASCFIRSASAITDESINNMLKLQPLFSVPVDDNDAEIAPLCCLPLESLVTVYRITEAILFRESVPCAF